MLRAFDSKTGKVLWTFQTGRQIAAGPTIFTSGGKEYVAITVGGTPTSSGGGLASQLQVFAIGGSKAESGKPPGLTSLQPPASPAAPTTLRQPASAPAARASAIRALSCSVRAAAGGARIAVPAGAITLGLWNANSSNLVPVKGKVLLGGKPVSGAVGVGRPLRAAAARPRPTEASRRSSTRRSRAAIRSPSRPVRARE